MISIARALTLAPLALTAASASATQPLPPALTSAITATQAAKAPYAFDLDVHSSDVNWRAHFDPAATPRLRLVEPAALDNDQRRAFDNAARRMEGLPWCASPEMSHIADARLLRETPEVATYAFQPTPESIRGEQARSFAGRLRGEVTLTKANPDIANIHIFAPAPFNPMLLMRIDRIDIAITCAPAPNGRRFASETVTQIRGSAFGQAINERSVQRAHDLAPS